ncbi:glutathione S-transferase [Brevirhabdus sp.]|uniref:glutathione S-transferase n=1 Tax=Brevirhabdus sp. TaxID=2004514 RepID=UPI004059CE93
MQLLSAGPSPYVRKVRVLLAEAGRTDAVEVVTVTASPLEPDAALTAVNPSGKVPALIRDDGPAVHDSRVICRYLDHRLGTRFYPQARIWEVLTLEATADAILDAALLCVYEKRFRPESLRSSDWTEGQWAKVGRSLDALEDRWMGHLGGTLDMGHIALGCALGYLDLRHADRNWRKGHDALDDWFASFSQRPSMMSTLPEV